MLPAQSRSPCSGCHCMRCTPCQSTLRHWSPLGCGRPEYRHLVLPYARRHARPMCLRRSRGRRRSAKSRPCAARRVERHGALSDPAGRGVGRAAQGGTQQPRVNRGRVWREACVTVRCGEARRPSGAGFAFVARSTSLRWFRSTVLHAGVSSGAFCHFIRPTSSTRNTAHGIQQTPSASNSTCARDLLHATPNHLVGQPKQFVPLRFTCRCSGPTRWRPFPSHSGRTRKSTHG